MQTCYRSHGHTTQVAACGVWRAYTSYSTSSLGGTASLGADGVVSLYLAACLPVSQVAICLHHHHPPISFLQMTTFICVEGMRVCGYEQGQLGRSATNAPPSTYQLALRLPTSTVAVLLATSTTLTSPPYNIYLITKYSPSAATNT